jgi:hypothetical protein
MIDPCHGRRPLAFRRTHMALRPIACNAADPYPSGDEPNPPKGASPAAAAALFIFLIVHAALEGVSRSADVLAALQ